MDFKSVKMRFGCCYFVVFTILTLGVVTLVSGNPFESEREDRHQYHGNQVLRVVATTTEAVKALQELQAESSYDFWTEPALGTNTDIMTTFLDQSHLERTLADIGLSFTVLIDDVQKLVSEERKENNMKASGEMNWQSYQRVDIIYDWMYKLPEKYKGIVTVTEIGKSSEGRPLLAAKVSTGGEGKEGIFLDAGFHAREWISIATATYILNELVTNDAYAQDRQNFDFYIIPVSNPDGYEYSHTNTRLWRKTRSDNQSIKKCRGVDLNRNFGLEWGGQGTSSDKCSDIYRGPSAFSEPEAVAIKNYILSIPTPTMYLTLHCYSQYFLLPWGYDANAKPDDFDKMKTLADVGVKALNAVHGTEYEAGHSASMLYAAAGASDDWAKGIGITYSFTIELRDTGRHGFLLPPEQIYSTGQETLASIIAMARYLQ